MILNLSKTQYRTLIEMLSLAEIKLNDFYQQALMDEIELEPYMHIAQHIYKHARKMDCEDGITFDKESQNHVATEGLLEFWSDYLFESDTDVLRDKLSRHLAMRDLLLRHWEKKDSGMIEREELEMLSTSQTQYADMIEQSGLARLQPISEDEFRQRYPSVDTEGFFDLQAMTMHPRELMNPPEDEPFVADPVAADNVLDFPKDREATRRKHPAKTSTPNFTYVLKVALKGAKPPVWRRLEVPDTLSLAQMHQIIQASFGLFDLHLHQFIPDHASLFSEPLTEEEEVDYPLHQLLSIEGNQCLYVYDFGDDWEFVITLEKIQPCQADRFASQIAFCTGGRRSGPIEDCGGIHLFNDLVKSIRQGETPEEFEWIFDVFNQNPQDPLILFDRDEINAQLAGLN
ncbi:plasmid pRiA4b ORF-3 family protein [Hydrogenovibrio halophilus]|uniref:plasmid pRiA4b ORF-3 family protein n=1 Tax=Hydrogenovibrio halophilus TaxID=373391 RepID=UPI0003818489|nr:plasmid pRiA4b ORF-3 family protein [Hydrogenovibrio halophilus]